MLWTTLTSDHTGLCLNPSLKSKVLTTRKLKNAIRNLREQISGQEGEVDERGLLHHVATKMGFADAHFEVFKNVVAGFVGREALTIMLKPIPYVGMIVAGASAAKNAVKAALLRSKAKEIARMQEDHFQHRDYFLAAQGVARYLRFEMKLAAASAAKSAAEVMIRIAPGTGVANAIIGPSADLVAILTKVAVFVRAKFSGDEAIRSMSVEEAMEHCPVLGCWLLSYGDERQDQLDARKRDRTAALVPLNPGRVARVVRTVSRGRYFSDTVRPETQTYHMYWILMKEAARICAEEPLQLDPSPDEDDLIDYDAESDSGSASSSYSSGASSSRSGSYSSSGEG